MTLRADGRVRQYGAHRVIWISAHRRPLPYGYQIDHKNAQRSDNRIENLEAVTGAENMRRVAASRTHCSKGHLFTGSNVRITASGSRRCRVCETDRHTADRKPRGACVRCGFTGRRVTLVVPEGFACNGLKACAKRAAAGEPHRPPIHDIRAGHRFGRLTVTADRAAGDRRVPCRCDCGQETRPDVYKLIYAYIKSCGCWRAEVLSTWRQGSLEKCPVESPT